MMITSRRGAVWAALAVLSALLFIASCQRAEEPPAGQPHIESTADLSTGPINERLSRAAREGEAWARDPIRVALEAMGTQGARSVKIERQDERGEAPRSSTVTVIEDGYLDDSLRGTWTRFTLERHDDGTWRVTAIQRAYRCWRGHHQDSYSARLCP